MPYTSRDHLRHTNRQITRFQRKVGTIVVWYEFDRENSQEDDLYDEGYINKSRMWKAPRRIPVYSIIRAEGDEVPGAEGQYTVDTIHISALLEQLCRFGLSEPYNAQRHLNDRIIYDNFVWEIRRYQIHGRLNDYETTVGIDATKVSPEEMQNDSQFTEYAQPPTD